MINLVSVIQQLSPDTRTPQIDFNFKKPHSHFKALLTLSINIYELLHSNYMNIGSYLFSTFVGGSVKLFQTSHFLGLVIMEEILGRCCSEPCSIEIM